MELNLTTLLIFASFVTPGILILAVIRSFIPKVWSVSANDFTITLIYILFAGIVNLNLFGWIACEFWKVAYLNNSELAARVFAEALGNVSYFPRRPSYWFFSFFFDNAKETDPLYLILDIHLRPVLITLVFLGLQKLLSELDEFLEALAISDYKSSCRNCFTEFLSCLFGYKSAAPKKGTKRKLRNPIKWIVSVTNTFLYHPWYNLTDFNSRTELLLVDVKLTNKTLISGVFTKFIPNGSSVDSISIWCGLKQYYPSKPNQEEKAPQNESSKFSLFHSSKKDYFLINNFGELNLPNSQIENTHFWKVGINSIVDININNPSDVHNLKWYVILANSHGRFFESLNIKCYLKPEDFNILVQSFALWLDDLDVPDELLGKINMENFGEFPDDQTGSSKKI